MAARSDIFRLAVELEGKVARLEAENAQLRADRDRLLSAAKGVIEDSVEYTRQKLREAIGER